MNEHDSLEETLAQFRKTLPPETVRHSNRTTVREALKAVDIPIRWWRRTISLPMPVVLATAAALLISLAAHVFPASNNAEQSRSGLPVDPSASGDDSGSSLIAAADSQVEYFETQRYLSGIGVIDRNVFYRIEE